MIYKNDAILISAHCDTDEKVESLRRLVTFLNSNGKDIFLVANTIIPQDIINSVRFFLYDSVNDVEEEKSLRFPAVLTLPGVEVCTRSIPWRNTLYPVLRMMFNGIRLCMMNGYTIIHYMEYDVDINSIDHIKKNNTDILNGKTCIYYRDESNNLMGGSLVFDTSKYPSHFFDYNKDTIRKKFGDLYESCEMYVYHELILPFNSLGKPLPSLEKDGIFFNKSNSKRNGIQVGVLFYDEGKLFYLLFIEEGCSGCNFEINIDGSIKSVYVGESGFYINEIPDNSRNVQITRDDHIIGSYDLENPEDIHSIKNQTEIIKLQE